MADHDGPAAPSNEPPDTAPAWATPVTVAGLMAAAYGGAIEVTVALPVVPGPSADVTTIPSLVIAALARPR